MAFSTILKIGFCPNFAPFDTVVMWFCVLFDAYPVFSQTVIFSE